MHHVSLSWPSIYTAHVQHVKAFEKFWNKDTASPSDCPNFVWCWNLWSSVISWIRSTKYVIWARNLTSLSHYFLTCKKDDTSLLYLTRWHPGEDELVFVNHMHCWLNVIVTTKRNSEFRHFILHGNKKQIAQGNKILNIFPPNVFFYS